MSKLDKTTKHYRGGDWMSNFKHINYTNVAQSVKSILTKRELNKQYDRLGNHSGTNGKLEPLSIDEQVFRICVLMDSQMEEKLSRVWGAGEIPRATQPETILRGESDE